MAKSVRSKKAKGRRLQNMVKAELNQITEGFLEKDDIRTAIMGESGTDIKFSPKAAEFFDHLAIECKNIEKLNFWKALEQAKKNTKQNKEFLLVLKRNFVDPVVVLDFKFFIKIFEVYLKHKNDGTTETDSNRNT